MGRNSKLQVCVNYLNEIMDAAPERYLPIQNITAYLKILKQGDNFITLRRYEKKYLLGKIEADMRHIFKLVTYRRNVDNPEYIYRGSEMPFCTKETLDEYNKLMEGFVK